MSIKIIKQGVQTTLQDTGRPGFRTIGIGTGGAADIFAMKTANFLAGNDDDMAVMEINFPAPEILFQQKYGEGWKYTQGHCHYKKPVRK